MVFSSLLFLGIFFPIVLVLYFINKNTTYRNVVLVIASLIFYAWGEPVWVLGMLFSSFVGWFFGLFIDKYAGKWQSKASLIMALVINLGMLGVFKYSGWIVGNINALLGTNIPFYGFSLPLVISFYTFQILTYDLDM